MRRPRSRYRVPAPLQRVVALLLLLPLIVGLIGVPAAAGDELSDAQSRQKALQQQIKEQKQAVAELNAIQKGLSQDIAATKTALAGINADLAAIRGRIDRTAATIAVVQQQYVRLVNQVAALEDSIATLEAAAKEKRLELAFRKGVLAQRIRATYETQQTSLIETILSGQTFTDVVADVSAYVDIQAQDRALAEQIARDRATLVTIQQSTETTKVETEVLREETRLRKVELDRQLAALKEARTQLRELERETQRQLAAQKRAYAKLTASKAALRRAIAANAAAQARLKRQIAKMIAEQARLGNIPSEYNGSMSWPMKGQITQEYGCTGFEWEGPKGDCAHFHEGIDIAAPMYTPVKAAAAGTVVFAGPNPYDPYPKAWIVIIAHAKNLQTWYAHLDNATRPPKVRAGDQVARGEVIAYNGMTGRTTGPHLHWMVELNGEFVNPRLFV